MIDFLRDDLCGLQDFEFISSLFSLILIGFLIAFLLFLFSSEAKEKLFKSYQQGQIDALYNAQKYYLKEYSNGERMWIRKEKNDDLIIPEIENHLIENKDSSNGT